MKQNCIFLLLCLASVMCFAQNGTTVKINGFGDMTYGRVFGVAANQEAADLFEAYPSSEYPNNVNQGFGIVGADFVITATLTENLTYQGEVNLQTDRGGSYDIGLDFERCYLDYNFSDKFGLQVGLFFTPIGFSNRNLYARAWLMNSIQIRDIVEEELEFVPTHSVGINAYGKFVNDNNGLALNYIVSLTNGRNQDPPGTAYARDFDETIMATGLLELIIPGPKEFRVGLSGYFHEFESFYYGPLTEQVSGVNTFYREIGFNPYIYYSGKIFNFFGEVHSSSIMDLRGNLPQSSYGLFGFTGELSYNTKLNDKLLRPYLRYDLTSFDAENHPYYGNREGSMVYVPNFNAFMVGLAYDLSQFNRVKIEYIHHLDGARSKHGISLQTAFGF